MPEDDSPRVTGRLRKASITMADTILNFNPQPGMWAATGTAIAQAPSIAELREPIAGGANIEFDEHGHSSLTVQKGTNGEPVLAKLMSNPTRGATPEDAGRPTLPRRQTLKEQAQSDKKNDWRTTTRNGFLAAWRFVSTPTGFLITIYGLNIVAWGAMLFFLLLDAAPAMDHPSKDDLSSPRKIWLEIDAQILNALFCVTGFGLAPWRFRDLWWLTQAQFRHNDRAMKRLCEQNKSWFRAPAWYQGSLDVEAGGEKGRFTFTGEVAPPTGIWKLSFVVWMMVLNTLFQGALSGFMWGYDRFNRPGWAAGAFIGLGCGVSLLAGVMMWWEGRKVKKIEGPAVKVVEAVGSETQQDSRSES